ncbi:hypothetical protein ACNF5K_05450 [Fannyhessea vaginae]
MVRTVFFSIRSAVCMYDEVYSSNTMLGIRDLYPSDDTYVRP